MLNSFMMFFGRRDHSQATRNAIVSLREQLQILEKKEDYLQKKIEEELKKAKANAVSNKAVATQALRRKKLSEAELDRLAGQRLQLESQINTLESANMNVQTLEVMKQGAKVLAAVHSNMKVGDVDDTMAKIEEQRMIASDIADAISGPPVDEDGLKEELEQLEQEYLDARLAGADHVPVVVPSTSMVPEGESEVDAQLKELQAALTL